MSCRHQHAACLVTASQWSLYLLAIVVHPVYCVKMPQLAWGVAACFAGPVLHLPAFIYATWYLDAVCAVSIQVSISLGIAGSADGIVPPPPCIACV